MTDLEDLFVSEVIDYDKDIEPHQFIMLYAGVGAGKNCFIDNLAKGEQFKYADGTPVERKYVLLVTSRRAKADEQRNSTEVTYDYRMGMFDDSDFWLWCNDDTRMSYELSPKRKLPELWGLTTTEVALRSCACTNAQIEQLWEEYVVEAACTHPWERFDMIVIDEVHAVLADASYQSSPFYVKRLMEETLKRSSTCKVIMMTGSPQILERDPFFERAHCIDLRERCRNLIPKEIVFLNFWQAEKKVLEMLQRGEKAIYFAKRIGTIKRILKQVSEQDLESVAVSFSDKAKRAEFKKEYKTVHANMEKLERMLATEQRVPEEINLVLSTARNKEGINIKNKDITTMFVEAHADIDVQQMAGRLREGVDTLYVILDGLDVTDSELPGEVKFTQKSGLLPMLNSDFQKLCAEHGLDLENIFDRAWALPRKELTEQIDFVHQKFPYVRFDYAELRFCFYQERLIGKEYYAEQEELFLRSMTTEGLKKLADSWYPGVRCRVLAKLENDKQKSVDLYLKNNGWLRPGTIIRGAEREKILRDINQIIGKEAKQLKSVLKHYGYDLETDGRKKRDSLSRIVRKKCG